MSGTNNNSHDASRDGSTDNSPESIIETRNERHIRGRKWSILTMLLIISITMVIILIRWMSEGSVYSIHKAYTYGFLVVLMLFGILSMIGLFCLARCTQYVIEVNHPEMDWKSLKQLVLIVIPLFVLCLFGLGSIIQDCIELNELRECFHEFTDRNELQWHITFHAIKILFIVFQAVFICLFEYKHKRCNSFFARQILLLVPTADFCIWFYILMSEWEHVTNTHSTSTSTLEPSTNVTLGIEESDTGNRTLYEQCLHHKTVGGVHNTNSQQFLYPFTMEFCLVSVGMLCSIWNLRDENTTLDKHETDQTQLSNNTDAPDSLLLDSNKRTELASCRILFFILSCVFITILIIIVCLGFKEEPPKPVYCTFYMLIQVIILLVTLIAWWLMRKEHSSSTHFGPNQVLLIVSCCILFVLTAFEFVPPYTYVDQAGYQDDDVSLRLLLAADTILLLSVLSQTCLVLKDVSSLDNPEIGQPLQVCFFVLMPFNCYMWFDDSFLAINLNTAIFEKHNLVISESDWKLIKFVLMPPCIFYRIHVAEMYSVKWVQS